MFTIFYTFYMMLVCSITFVSAALFCFLLDSPRLRPPHPRTCEWPMITTRSSPSAGRKVVSNNSLACGGSFRR